MKSKTPCADEYRKSSEARRAYPLPSGGYKLVEVRTRLEQTSQAVTNFMRETGSGRSPVWIRQIPTMIAGELGYNVIPAISALVGDGLPLAQVRKLLTAARTAALDIVRRCDVALARLGSSVSAQHSRLLIENIMLEALLRDALDLVEAPD